MVILKMKLVKTWNEMNFDEKIRKIDFEDFDSEYERNNEYSSFEDFIAKLILNVEKSKKNYMVIEGTDSYHLVPDVSIFLLLEKK